MKTCGNAIKIQHRVKMPAGANMMSRLTKSGNYVQVTTSNSIIFRTTFSVLRALLGESVDANEHGRARIYSAIRECCHAWR